MITLADYFMGRREQFPLALSPRIEGEAHTTVTLAGKLIERARLYGVTVPPSPRTGSLVTSGWRPPALNATVPGAAVNSKHMTGQAIDLYDPDGDLDEWLLTDAGQQCLSELGLWMEHPSATKGWCHLQTVAPRSGRRVFYP